jgi:hypothetical protein
MTIHDRGVSCVIFRFLIALTFLILLPWSESSVRLALNRLAISSVHAALSETHSLPAEDDPLLRLARKDCHAHWFEGFVYASLGDDPGRDSAWAQAIRCDCRYIPILVVLLPQKRSLAEVAVQEWPESGESWFWLANTYVKREFGSVLPVEEEERNTVVALYQQGLALSPSDGLRWRELGDLLLPHDPHAALNAYVQSCLTGQHRAHGCWCAGKTAEQLGDIENAIRYYRLYPWEWSHQKADELEAQLEQGPQGH